MELSERTFLDLQNRFRGQVSEFRSRKFVKDRKVSQSQAFRSGLRNLLLDARAQLDPIQFAPFLGWVRSQLDQVMAELATFPIRYEELSGIYVKAPEGTLERELLWLTELISSNSPRINSFRAIVREIETQVFADGASSAIAAIELLEEFAGVTVWSVQLRLALEQASGGLEKQKQYAAGVRAIYQRGLLGFITYHSSVRNEDKTTIGNFSENILKRIDGHKHYDDAIKHYLRYKLLSIWPSSEKAAADILRVEQSHPLLDIYETFVRALQELVLVSDNPPMLDVVRQSLFRLTDIDDFRLDKLRFLLDGALPKITRPRKRAVADALFDGKIREAVSHWMKSKKAHVNDVDAWELLYAGFAYAHRSRTKPTQKQNAIVDYLARFHARNGPVEEAFHSLEKATLNLSGLPAAAAIAEYVQQVRRERPDDEWAPWRIGLNSPTYGVEDKSPRHLISPEAAPIGAAASAWQSYWTTMPSAPGDTITSCLAAAGHLRDNNYNDAADMLDCPCLGDPVRSLKEALQLHAYFGLGNRTKVIELIANEGARNNGASRFLPVLPALQHYDWQDYRKASALASPIALQLLWRANDKDITASLLRFATREFLKVSGQ